MHPRPRSIRVLDGTTSVPSAVTDADSLTGCAVPSGVGLLVDRGRTVKKWLALSAITVMSATLFTVVAAGTAGAVGPPATGTIGCKISGGGTFSPGLNNVGSSAAVKINFKAVGGCSGTVKAPNSAGLIVPVAVSSVAISGTGSFVKAGPGFANKCSAFQANDRIGVISVTYTWTSVPAIAPTVVKFTGGTASIVSPIIPLSLFDKIKLPGPAGTIKVTTGSFAPAVAPVVVLDTNILKTCSGTWAYTPFTIKPGSYINLP